MTGLRTLALRTDLMKWFNGCRFAVNRFNGFRLCKGGGGGEESFEHFGS